jgi:hypothetical protein
MDKDFQTSFIPKKSVTESRIPVKQPTGFLNVVAVFIFIAVLISTGGLFLYEQSINSNITQMQKDLVLSKERFDPTQIQKFQVLDKRLKASTDILNKHIVVTPIFLALEELTMKSIRYTKFDYTLGTPEQPNILVKMSGVANDYRSVALQSDLYAKNKNMIDPVFTKLSLDDSGKVMFDLDFLVDPKFLNYKLNPVTTNSLDIQTNVVPGEQPTQPVQ